MKRIMVIVAHPDDEVLGMGGTIAKLARNGAEIGLLIVTDGSSSQYKESPELLEIIENKKKETEAAGEILGISTIQYGGLPDMKLDTVPHTTINRVIENAIDSFNPEVVFTHFSGDVNLDHKLIFASTVVACRPSPDQKVKELYSFSVPSSTEWNVQNSETGFSPNTFVDIEGEYAEKKYAAMSSYSTELRDYPHPRSIEALKTLDKAVGIQVGLKCAESFMAHRVLK